MTTTIGWDIGGAHLKAALLDQSGRALNVVQLACPLWRGIGYLKEAIAESTRALGEASQHAITMTGELADIFPNRHQGVMQISQTMQHFLPNKNLRFFAGLSGFVAPQDVEANAALIASANWLASAQFVARKCGEGYFLDVGSTTTDIVVVEGGFAKPGALTDGERLATEELVYSGVVRTPVMAVVQRVPFNGQMQRVTAENFATMADVYRLTGKLANHYDHADTADGQGKSQIDSARRLARMVGRDIEDAPMLAWQALAHFIANAQLQDMLAAIKRQPAMDKPLVGAGVGRFLVKELASRLHRPFVDFSELLQGDAETVDAAAVCAPAYAVSYLAQSQ